MKTELLPSASTAQTTSNVLTKFRIQMIHLAFSSEHSMNILTWTFIQFLFWTMRGSFLNIRPNIPGMFHECYRAHWVFLQLAFYSPEFQLCTIATEKNNIYFTSVYTNFVSIFSRILIELFLGRGFVVHMICPGILRNPLGWVSNYGALNSSYS